MNYRYENLKITFDMQTPICMSYPWIFFDSILSHIAARRADPDSYRKLDSKRVSLSLLESKKVRDLPIKWDKIFHASCSQLNDENVSFSTIYKRFADSALFNLHKNIKMTKGWKVRRGQGFFKDHMIRLVTFHVKKISFYVCGDAREITDMLQDLPGLGKKTSIGFGFFNSYNIENTEHDFSIAKNGIAMRPIPVQMADFYDDVAMMNFKPPYWSNNVTKCVPPGAKVILK